MKTEKKLKEESKLLPEKRYALFIEETLAQKAVYFLIKDAGAYACSSFEESTLIPVWSDYHHAEANATHNWEDFQVQKIDLIDLEPVLDFIEDQSWILDVFPVAGKTGTLVHVAEFIADLNKAASQKS